MSYLRTESPSWSCFLMVGFLVFSELLWGLFWGGGCGLACFLCCRRSFWSLKILVVYWNQVQILTEGKCVLIIARGIGRERGAEMAVVADVPGGCGMAQMVMVVLSHLWEASEVTLDNNSLNFSVLSPTLHSVPANDVSLCGKALWDLLEMAPN